MSEEQDVDVMPELPEDRSLMTSEAVEGLPRHEDLWFEDGNIVIATSDLSFRLHRGVLARHSSVFKDMFQLPPTDQARTAEDCPVVQLHDRSADLVMLFTLLYDGIKDPTFRPNEAIEFKTLRALLRLSYKYDIPHLQLELRDRLGARFSPSMEEWDEEAGTGRLIKMWPRDAIAVVNLARAYDFVAILPVALFECCQLPKLQLVTKVDYGKDDVEQLSPGDLRLCLGALDQLTRRSQWVRKVLLDDSMWEDLDCATPNECRLARHELVRELMFSVDDDSFHSTNPLVRLTRQVTEAVEEEDINLCKTCQESYEEWEGVERRMVWRDLGKMFGLHNWLGSLG